MTDGRTRAEILTFLIADVRGYTMFTQERGDEAAAKLAARFAQLAREGVEGRGGDVIELRGDEALAVFGSARQAIWAAVELQARFVEETIADPSVPLGVGIGLDAGEAVPVEGGYRGGALNLAARLCGMAGPGEVLASREVVHLARKIEGLRYVDRGEVTLKGIAEPITPVRVAPDENDPAALLAQALPPRAPSAPPPRRSRRRLAAVLVAAGVALAIVAAVVLVPNGDDAGSTLIPPDAVGAFDRGTGELLGTVSVGSRPSAVAEGEDAIWVANADDATVSRIDPVTRSVVDTIAVGADPEALAVGDGAVWVANADDRSVSQIDPGTNAVVQTIAVGNGPLAIAASPTGIWVANSVDGTVQRIDPEAGTAGKPVTVGAFPSGIAANASDVWVANRSDGTVSDIDAASRKVVSTVGVGTEPSGIATTDDGVWVTNRADGTVSVIQPDTGAVSMTTAVGDDLSVVTAVGDDRWVASGSVGSVWQLTAAGTPARTIQVGAAPSAAAIVGDEVWVAVVASSSGAHRGGTLRVVSGAGPAGGRPDSIDPAFAYDFVSWSILTTTNDGLVGYRKSGGIGGTTLVPDLATGIPAPTESGRTYTFQLRSDVRYSDSTAVTPEDFRTAIERALRLGTPRPDYYAGIVGASACIAHPDTCDLSRGIETDDAAGTIVFHLVAPDADFLSKLALPFAFPVPASTPDRTATQAAGLREPLPATGPYQITSYDGETMTLERNPVFHEWSAAAQPDGFPDRIEWTFGTDTEKGISQVERGQSDVVFEGVSPDRVHEVTTRYALQTHVSPIPATTFLTLNTRRPPFDDVGARRAVNFLIDRGAFVDLLGGPSLAKLSCQVLPPNMPGFRPYCPYTLHPSPTGEWISPDLPKALALVRASGTKGARIDVATFAGLDPGGTVAHAVVEVLDRLGYRATIVDFGADGAAYFGSVADSSQEIEVALYAWATDYPSPSSFITDLLTCDAFVPDDPANVNVTGFCDPSVDAAIQEALELQTRDPGAAGGRWAAIDRMITDAAPLVPLNVHQRVDLVSERVGNYQRHPEWGILFDQLWVV